MFRQASCLQYLPYPSLLSGARAGFRSPHRPSASPRYGRRSLSGLLNCHLPLADLDFTLAWCPDPRDEILEPVVFGLPNELGEGLFPGAPPPSSARSAIGSFAAERALAGSSFPNFSTRAVRRSDSSSRACASSFRIESSAKVCAWTVCFSFSSNSLRSPSASSCASVILEASKGGGGSSGGLWVFFPHC